MGAFTNSYSFEERESALVHNKQNMSMCKAMCVYIHVYTCVYICMCICYNVNTPSGAYIVHTCIFCYSTGGGVRVDLQLEARWFQLVFGGCCREMHY